MQDFIQYLEEQYKNHSIYIWGGQGQAWPTVTEEWIKKKESGTHEKNALKTYRAAVNAGYQKKLRAFDCSGLGMYYIQQLAGLSKSDMNAHGMMGKCTLISKGEVKKGCWVFKRYTTGTKRAYHIGYVVDDALNVIEAQGRAYGVVKRPLSKGGWNAYGIPSYFKKEIMAQDGGDIDISGRAYTFTRNLKKGCKGQDVANLQTLLNENGDDLKADGDFGTKTRAAVREYQKRKGLKVDGIAGKNTVTALGARWAG